MTNRLGQQLSLMMGRIVPIAASHLSEDWSFKFIDVNWEADLRERTGEPARFALPECYQCLGINSDMAKVQKRPSKVSMSTTSS